MARTNRLIVDASMKVFRISGRDLRFIQSKPQLVFASMKVFRISGRDGPQILVALNC